MKKMCLAMCLLVLAAPALARKDCEVLKQEIAAKLDARGVPAYRLEIVDKGQAGSASVVGSCDGGTREITYARGAVNKPLSN